MTRPYAQLADYQIRRVVKAVRLRLKLSDKALAQREGVSPAVIKATLQRARIPQLSDHQVRRIIKARRLRLKLSGKALATREGVSTSVIKTALASARARGEL